MNTQHLYSPCKFIKSTGLHQKIEVKNRVSRPRKDSNKKCNGILLTLPQGKAARRGG